jgi:DNA-binding CsgD family transcriptional regulator
VFEKSIASLLECVPLAAVVVDSGRSIRAANNLASETLVGRDGLHIDNQSRLRLNCRAADHEFSNLLGNAAPRHFKSVLCVSRGQERFPWLLQVTSLEARANGATSMVCWLDPRRPPTTDCSLLKAAFGLSPAEVRVATHLTNGDELSLIAGKLGIQQDTVRTHLKSTFRKMGIHRQQELVRVVTMLSFFC